MRMENSKEIIVVDNCNRSRLYINKTEKEYFYTVEEGDQLIIKSYSIEEILNSGLLINQLELEIKKYFELIVEDETGFEKPNKDTQPE